MHSMNSIEFMKLGKNTIKFELLGIYDRFCSEILSLNFERIFHDDTFPGAGSTQQSVARAKDQIKRFRRRSGSSVSTPGRVQVLL